MDPIGLNTILEKKMGALNVSNIVSQVVKDIGLIEDVLSSAVCEGIKTLLEGRHLYQNVKFGEAKCRDAFKKYLSNPETSSRIEEEINPTFQEKRENSGIA